MEDIAVRSTFAPAFGRGHEYMDSLEGYGGGGAVFPAWRRGALEKTLKKVAGKFGRE